MNKPEKCWIATLCMETFTHVPKERDRAEMEQHNRTHPAERVAIWNTQAGAKQECDFLNKQS